MIALDVQQAAMVDPCCICKIKALLVQANVTSIRYSSI